MSLSDWVDARDSAALVAAWAGLGARAVELEAPPSSTITPHGCARLAAAMLGWPIQELAWLAAAEDALPPPTFEARRTVPRSFAEHAIDHHGDCLETWRLREQTVGARGVHHFMTDIAYDDGSREGAGGSATIIRVFDRDAGVAASVYVHARTVWLVGDVDLAPLDLYARFTAFRTTWPYDLDAVRALIAALAGELDASFATAAAWPGAAVERTFEAYDVRSHLTDRCYASGSRTLDLVERRVDPAPDVVACEASVIGLPWGHALSARLRGDATTGGIDADLQLRLPVAHADAVLARLAATAGVTVTD